MDDDGHVGAGEDEDDEDEGDGGMRQAGRLKGTGVVVFLYKDSYGIPHFVAEAKHVTSGCRVPLSQHLQPLLIRLAAAHPSTKFLSIPAGLCIPNYPDKNVPTLLIYRNGEITGNVVAGQGLQGMKTTVRGMSTTCVQYTFTADQSSPGLEALLIRYKATDGASLELRRGKEDAEEDEEDSYREEIGMVNGKSGGLRSASNRGPGVGEEDSGDSDFDM